MKKKAGWLRIVFSILTLAAVIFLLREPILNACGKFMAPTGNDSAEIAIVEGTEFINRGIVKDGIKLLSLKKVKRLVIVLYKIAPYHRPFAFNEDYTELVRKELIRLGLKEKDFQIIVTHIHDPITLTSAKGAMEAIAKDKVKTAILLSEGFHTRRSFLAYQYVGSPLQVKIFPHACFSSYDLDHWWQKEDGPRDFFYESVKLFYYLVRGYIPLKFSYS
jgi:hypothetical protein